MKVPNQIYDSGQLSALISGKKIAYMDQNLWIDCCDETSTGALELKKKIRELVKNDLLVVPLAWPAISELIDQPNLEIRRKRAEFMDEISGGVIIRNSNIQEETELLRILTRIHRPDKPESANRNQAYGFIFDYISDTFNAIYIDKIARWFEGQIATNFMNAERFRSVQAMLEMLHGSEIRARSVQETGKYQQEMQLEFDITRADILNNKRNKDDVLRLIREKSFPRLERLMENIRLEAGPRMREIIEENIQYYRHRHGRLFQFVPTADIVNQLYTIQLMDKKRKVRPQDFYDIEHARIMPYCDIFATRDSFLFDTAKLCAKRAKLHECDVIKGIDGLLATLNKSPFQIA